jgi:hypothetical protein
MSRCGSTNDFSPLYVLQSMINPIQIELYVSYRGSYVFNLLCIRSQMQAAVADLTRVSLKEILFY